MPEERGLLDEGRPGGDHPVEPVVAAAPRPHHARLLVVEPARHEVAHPPRIGRVEKLLDRRVVTPRGAGLDLVAGRAEAGAAHQVGYQPGIFAHDALRCFLSCLPTILRPEAAEDNPLFSPNPGIAPCGCKQMANPVSLPPRPSPGGCARAPRRPPSRSIPPAGCGPPAAGPRGRSRAGGTPASRWQSLGP